MTTLEKILIGLLAFVVVISGGVFIYEKYNSAKQLQAMSDQMTSQKQLVDGITRSLGTYATKQDMEQFAKDSNVNLDAIKKDLASLNSSLTAMNSAVVISVGQSGNNIPSTSTTPNQNPSTSGNGDPYGYQKNIQNLHMDEKFSDNTQVPIGDVSFDASKPAPWGVNIKAREYQATTTLGVDENQKYTAYNNFSVTVDGKKYPITITNSKLIQQFPQAKFYFNPRLFITAGGGVDLAHLPAVGGSFNVGGMVGLFSYGKFKTNPDISILQIGAGYQSNRNEFTAIVNPVMFNIGAVIPGDLVKNTYIGPSVQITPSGSAYVGGNVSIGF